MRILVADSLSDAGVAALAADHEVDVKTGLSKDELLAVIPTYDAVVVRSATTIDADVIEVAANLKVIARAGVGLDNVDVEAATRHGVIVCNAPQSNVISAAEHTVALICAMARNIPQAHAALVAGSWERSKWQGTELHGKTLGVLGLGRIGTLVAQRCNAFGMRLVAYDPYVAPERAGRMGVTLFDTVEEVLAASDFVTIHLPKTPDTVGLINADSLQKMKPTARVVNVARGGIVDEQALADAIRDGVIAGAALDVFADEPTTESPLFDLPSVIVTPHLGASTDEAQDKAGVQVADAVNLALAGELVPSAVNVQGGPVDDAVKPFLPLAEKLGRLFTALADEGLAGDVTVEFHGALAEHDCRVAGLSVLKGMLSGVSSEPVTFVNAPLIAEDRGLNLREMSNAQAEDYVSLLRVVGTGRDGEQIAVAGTIFQPGDRERIVEIWNSDVDLEPASHMAFFRYEDRPGVIGAVGSGFGDAGVNIASAQVGRTTAGGSAVMALALDDAADRATVDAIAQAIGAEQARVVTLS